MSDLPKTILHPAAFMESLPAGFDGIFHWDYIQDVTIKTRGIQPADIDCCIHNKTSDLFLSIETRAPGKEIPNGQRWRTDALLRTGLFAHIEIWGKDIPKQWQVRAFGGDGTLQESSDGREQIASIVDNWMKWSEQQSRDERDYRALSAAWTHASPRARDLFAKNALRVSLGDYDNTPLGSSILSKGGNL